LSSSELLANIFNVDGANMMANIIFSKNKHLVVNPEFVDDVLETFLVQMQIVPKTS
jgi:hypothetical protein